jgi:hypothetical protein
MEPNMKNAFITIVTSVTIVLIAGCGDQKQSNATPPSGASTVAAPIPVQEKFESVTVRLDAPAFGGVDGINDVTAPKVGSTIAIKGEKITIVGNFVDAIKGEAAAGVVAIIGGKPYVAIYGGERPDIAKTLNNSKYLKSQFYIEVPTSTVGAGLHDLKIRVIAADKSGYYESNLIAKLDVK